MELIPINLRLVYYENEIYFQLKAKNIDWLRISHWNCSSQIKYWITQKIKIIKCLIKCLSTTLIFLANMYVCDKDKL